MKIKYYLRLCFTALIVANTVIQESANSLDVKNSPSIDTRQHYTRHLLQISMAKRDAFKSLIQTLITMLDVYTRSVEACRIYRSPQKNQNAWSAPCGLIEMKWIDLEHIRKNKLSFRISIRSVKPLNVNVTLRKLKLLASLHDCRSEYIRIYDSKVDKRITPRWCAEKRDHWISLNAIKFKIDYYVSPLVLTSRTQGRASPYVLSHGMALISYQVYNPSKYLLYPEFYDNHMDVKVSAPSKLLNMSPVRSSYYGQTTETYYPFAVKPRNLPYWHTRSWMLWSFRVVTEPGMSLTSWTIVEDRIRSARARYKQHLLCSVYDGPDVSYPLLNDLTTTDSHKSVVYKHGSSGHTISVMIHINLNHIMGDALLEDLKLVYSSKRLNYTKFSIIDRTFNINSGNKSSTSLTIGMNDCLFSVFCPYFIKAELGYFINISISNLESEGHSIDRCLNRGLVVYSKTPLVKPPLDMSSKMVGGVTNIELLQRTTSYMKPRLVVCDKVAVLEGGMINDGIIPSIYVSDYNHVYVLLYSYTGTISAELNVQLTKCRGTFIFCDLMRNGAFPYNLNHDIPENSYDLLKKNTLDYQIFNSVRDALFLQRSWRISEETNYIVRSYADGKNFIRKGNDNEMLINTFSANRALPCSVYQYLHPGLASVKYNRCKAGEEYAQLSFSNQTEASEKCTAPLITSLGGSEWVIFDPDCSSIQILSKMNEKVGEFHTVDRKMEDICIPFDGFGIESVTSCKTRHILPTGKYIFYTSNLKFLFTSNSVNSSKTFLVAHYRDTEKIFDVLGQSSFKYLSGNCSEITMHITGECHSVCVKMAIFYHMYLIWNVQRAVVTWHNIKISQNLTYSWVDHVRFKLRVIAIQFDVDSCSLEEMMLCDLRISIDPKYELDNLITHRYKLTDQPCCPNDLSHLYFVLWRDAVGHRNEAKESFSKHLYGK